MTFLGVLYAALAWTWLQYLPGHFVSRLFVPDARGIERLGLAMLCGFSTFPLAVFLVTVGAGIPMDAQVVGVAATAVNLVGLLALGREAPSDFDLRGLAAIGGCAVLCGLFLAFGIRSLDGGDVFSTVHHCLYVIVMHTIGNDSSAAIPLYDGLSQGTMNYLVSHPTTEFNGLAPLFFEQRLGNAPILAPAVAALGTAGWFTTAVFASVAAGLFVALAARELGVRWAPAIVASALFVYGMRTFCMYFINENNFAVTLVAFLCWGALRGQVLPGGARTSLSGGLGWVALMGITCGHLVGVRYTSSLFWPAVALAVLWHSDPLRDRLRRFAVGAPLAVLALLPWLYVNKIMLGKAFTHPKVHSEFASRIVENTLFGHTFEFRALNWPVADELLRTAWNPFPTWIWLPLWALVAWGQSAGALGVLGLGRLLAQRRNLVALLVFALPHSLAIGVLETLDWEQLTYAAPGFVPFGVILAVGLDALWPTTAGWGAYLAATRRSWAIALVALIAIVAGARAFRGSEWPVDTRTLVAADWPSPPPADRGTEAVGNWLTGVALLPFAPVWRSEFAGFTADAFAHLLRPEPETVRDGLRVYPSGRVAILSGYSPPSPMQYDFVLEGAPARAPGTPLRASLGLHTVALTFRAERLRMHVASEQGHYRVDVLPEGEASEPRDFTLYLHPWNPPMRSIGLTTKKRPLTSSEVRVLTYGGAVEDGEARFIATNYPPEVIDVQEIPYTVDLNGERTTCGLFLFLTGVDASRVETLVLAGGHDAAWKGQREGVLKVPKPFLADGLVLFSEPYCSDHVPQYGDRYGVATGPFQADKPLRLTLDQQW